MQDAFASVRRVDAGVVTKPRYREIPPIRARNSREDGMDNGLNVKLETRRVSLRLQNRVSLFIAGESHWPLSSKHAPRNLWIVENKYFWKTEDLFFLGDGLWL